jgi:hypothetical protein
MYRASFAALRVPLIPPISPLVGGLPLHLRPHIRPIPHLVTKIPARSCQQFSKQSPPLSHIIPIQLHSIIRNKNKSSQPRHSSISFTRTFLTSLKRDAYGKRSSSYGNKLVSTVEDSNGGSRGGYEYFHTGMIVFDEFFNLNFKHNTHFISE